jgi:hypothetical protein
MSERDPLVVRLKSGNYDGTDIMLACLRIEEGGQWIFSSQRIAELKAENERLHGWIDAYCGQPDQKKILSEFERRINAAETRAERAEYALREVGELASWTVDELLIATSGQCLRTDFKPRRYVCTDELRAILEEKPPSDRG